MPPRPEQLRSILFATLLLWGGSVSARAEPTLATNPALTFFSSLSEAPFARLEATSIAPDYTRHGPFRLPAPGVRIESPVLTLFDQPCTAEDWKRALHDIAAWQRVSASDDFVIILPDGRFFAFLGGHPGTAQETLSGVVSALAAAPSGGEAPPRQILRVSHDGAEHLRIELRSTDPASSGHPAAPPPAPPAPPPAPGSSS